MRRDIRIVFAGGGTGGHVLPAIYMADYLKRQWGADCQFVGTKRGMKTIRFPRKDFWSDISGSADLDEVFT